MTRHARKLLWMTPLPWLALGAPADAAELAGTTAQERPVALTTAADGRVERVEIAWRARCTRPRAHVTLTTVIRPKRADALRGRLTTARAYRVVQRRGLRLHVRIGVTGRRADGAWRGAVAVRVEVRRRGTVVDRCRLRATRWQAAPAQRPATPAAPGATPGATAPGTPPAAPAPAPAAGGLELDAEGFGPPPAAGKRAQFGIAGYEGDPQVPSGTFPHESPDPIGVRAGPSRLEIRVTDETGAYVVDIRTPPGRTFAPGPFQTLPGDQGVGDLGNLNVTRTTPEGQVITCPPARGVVRVKEATFDTRGAMQTMSLEFERGDCDWSDEVQHGYAAGFFTWGAFLR